MNYYDRIMNMQGRPASMIVGSVASWSGGHKHAQHQAAEIALEADREIARLRAALEDIADGMGETDLAQIGRFAPAVARSALGQAPHDAGEE